MKPFKPPTLVAKTPANSQCFPLPVHSSEPPLKRRRVSSESSSGDVEATVAAAQMLSQKQSKHKAKFQAPIVRKPLNDRDGNGSGETKPAEGHEAYYNVLWRKFTAKKNKTWDGDGVLRVVNGNATLQDISGRELGRAALKSPLLIGSELSICGKDVEVDSIISKEDVLAGRHFLGSAGKVAASSQSLREIDGLQKVSAQAQARHDKTTANQKDRLIPAVASSKASKAGFKAPVQKSTAPISRTHGNTPIPRHAVDAPNALVMKRPQSAPKGKQLVDVVVDPILTRALHEHQRLGVAFLYECVMGLKDYEGEGAILADAMGLGKTLQTITLLWTLLKQNPIYDDGPVIKKALIVCPVSLINTWRKEIRKWLGNERVGVFVVDETSAKNKMRLTDFTMGKSYQIMIVGYERLRAIASELSKTPGGIDIVIADEGHRLKTAQNKSAAAIKQLNTERRVILSGTPIQNDLAEFFHMVDFVNPGLLNKHNVFKREFEIPIEKSRQPGATEKDLQKGEARSEELASITSMFILRRTAEILSKYLPPKTEYVVFCRPTKAQGEVYRRIIGSSTFNAALGSNNMALELITLLKKVCNSPSLLLKSSSDKSETAVKPELIGSVPSALLKSPGASTKLQVLDSLLHQIKTQTDEKVVLVSNYTSTLDILQQLLTSLGYTFLRLDGSTPSAKRQDLIDRFNRKANVSAVLPASFTGGKLTRDEPFIFLLSAKAGGMGINLFGASRLVLFDLDWNPAIDLQAMARIHRHGQTRPCFVYRLLVQGALDEKIFQRQVSKTGLADSVVDGKNGASGFTVDELRDLFRLDERENGCQTHDLLQCACGGNGSPPPDLDTTIAPTVAIETAIAAGTARDSDVDILDLAHEYELDASDGDDSLSFQNTSKYTTGAKVDMVAQEEQIRRKAKECRDSTGRAKMLSLMQYSHFDTNLVGAMTGNTRAVADDKSRIGQSGQAVDGGGDESFAEQAIEDACLRAVIEEEGSRVGFVMSKAGAG